MIQFKKLTIDDIDIIRPFFEYSNSLACDNTIGGSVMWRDFFDTWYSIIDNTLLFRMKDPNIGTCFATPMGENPIDSINKIIEYTKNESIKTFFCPVAEDDLCLYSSNYNIITKELIDWSDYIYNAIDLIELKGRKYSGQRNHINYFKSHYNNWSVLELNSNNIINAQEFLKKFSLYENKNSIIFKEELYKTYEVFDFFEKYKMHGIILKVNDTIVGVAAGEIIEDVLYAHIEKANMNYKGSYQVLMNEFAKKYASDVQYINREETVGDKGLEISKMQYHPTIILKKYCVEIIN
ncbi:MAG: phosphatidylglycerol lysyltransferase domain-containing protein [Eubacteriales bacterium]|nr:phosphatidylglycerol lysyltransferase domain-containing protein [Eubacteriales bacterium]